MKIRSKKTGLEHNVSKQDWEKMVERGDARRYIIVSEASSSRKPKVLDDADYKSILKEATKLFKEKKYVEALEKYKKLNSIKPTSLIGDKIDEIEQILS